MGRTTRFQKDQSGAVTVDGIGIMGAVVTLGLAVATNVSGGVENLANDIAAKMQSTSAIVQASAEGWFASFTTEDSGTGGGNGKSGLDNNDKKNKKNKKNKDGKDNKGSGDSSDLTFLLPLRGGDYLTGGTGPGSAPA